MSVRWPVLASSSRRQLSCLACRHAISNKPLPRPCYIQILTRRLNPFRHPIHPSISSVVLFTRLYTTSPQETSNNTLRIDNTVTRKFDQPLTPLTTYLSPRNIPTSARPTCLDDQLSNITSLTHHLQISTLSNDHHHHVLLHRPPRRGCLHRRRHCPEHERDRHWSQDRCWQRHIRHSSAVVPYSDPELPAHLRRRH